ncbi:restriction endonuclease subunit S [Streptomyces sp. WA6-1-16]|uniref:restriction endonuclease subunit S n=1 Tax=Streptomyces sp. WA6-1-16 TaxID=2879427 RepID=UPI001CE30B54|nr:restriction endonuclease subunit S [Streptomyces sp. WA6-1-16]UCA51847.1 restriction endonuclease subunit S [Streptomyces sp. WA6-1-16]
MTQAIISPFPVTPFRRFIKSLTDGPFGSSLTSSHYSNEGARVIRLGNIGSAEFRSSDEAYIPLEYFHELQHHEVKPGDLIIAGLGDSNHPVGRACLAPESLGPAIVKADCFRARLDESRLTHRYAAWALSSSAVSQQIRTLTRGTTRTRINLDVVREIQVPMPLLGEQHRIAEFLDAETARIDSLSEARNRQLALLNERTSTLIFDAVRGRSEPGPRKESSIDWLGSVPTSWPIMPVSYQFEVLLGKMLNQERAKGAHPAPYLRNTNVQWDRVTTDDLLTMSFPPADHHRYAVHPGDLLVCEGGEPGRAAIWNGQMEKIYYQKALHRIRPRGYSSPRWLFYFLRAATSQNVFAVEGNSTTISHLTGEQLRGYRLPFPKREVQDRLVNLLDSSSQRQAILNQTLRTQLGILAERRQALITAAVTGQFDVSTASGRNVTDGV